MSRFDRYEALVADAADQTKKGGDSANGLVFALLALAEAIVATEDTGDRHVDGTLTVDQA